jgi:hypothetical protein
VEYAHLAVVQRRGRLVHDQHPGVVRQRLGDLDHLLLGDGEFAHAPPRIERQFQPLDEGAGAVVEGAVVEQRAAARLPADEDVLRDRQVGHQVELLVDDADAELLRMAWAGDAYGLAVEQEFARVRRVDARKQLHERRLAGAVLSDEGEHLAVAQVETHVLQRPYPWEALRDAAHLKQRRRSAPGHVAVTALHPQRLPTKP